MKLNYIIIPLITVLVAVGGSWLTSSGIDSGWYDSIVKPSWTPAGSVIGTVWTILFILTTISALIVWNASINSAQVRRWKWIITIFLVNAGLNVFWSFLFFNQHLIGPAIWEAGLLGATVIALAVLIWPISRWASVLLIPYAGWTAFAAYLTYSIWLLNK